jgi:hypothetical protein
MFAAVALLSLAVACGGGGEDIVPTATAAIATPTLPPAGAAALCAGEAAVVGTVESPELIEVSGIAGSRRNEDVIWVHNDSGDTARFFGITAEGKTVASFALVGAEAVDWEDMAVGPGPGEGVSYVYLGDIGDNNAQRSQIVVYRVPEPAVSPVDTTPPVTEISEFDSLTLHYPDHPHDAETLIVDPVDGDLLIVTKDIATSRSQVFRLPANADPGEYTLEEVAQIDFSALHTSVVLSPDAPPLPRALPNVPTGGDVSRSGKLVAIRTYGSVWLWTRPDGAPLWEAFAGTPCEGPSAIETQGEAIGIDAVGAGYITVSEGTNPRINLFLLR